MKFKKLPAIDPDKIREFDFFLLFETSLCNSDNFLSYIFLKPCETIKVYSFKDVPAAFSSIERHARSGRYLAGYFSYELGYFFEDFKASRSQAYPLINICVFEEATIFNHKTGRFSGERRAIFTENKLTENFSIANQRLSIGKRSYIRKVNRIRRFIRQGQTYQVNFTNKLLFDFSGSAFAFYENLKSRQRVSFSAFCKFEDEHILSLSPELFFKRKGSFLWSKPMKGTIRRGKSAEEDRRLARALRESRKERAENLMVVDLIRNDLGRICRPGSIRVSSLFKVERYATLHQMTSTVRGTLREAVTYFDIFKALFPGGSVTGAPKIRTMQIIKALESGSRNIYCGALGMILPRQKAVFNLPIRTVSLRGGRGEMGIGSGIVWDSDADSEFQECLLKARFLTCGSKNFSLLETILWKEGQYSFLNGHLERMKGSAHYFGFRFNETRIRSLLKAKEKKFKYHNSYKVRLLLNKDGTPRLLYERFLPAQRAQNYVALSDKRTDPGNTFYYHKTTNRMLYDSEYALYAEKGYFDVIFMNSRNEVTEGAISNIIVQKGGRLYTPPVSSGLLAGLMRLHLLKKGIINEKKIYPDELFRAERIFLCNSVRGITEVRLKQ